MPDPWFASETQSFAAKAGTGSQAPSLDWLIHPTGKEVFFRDHFEQRPLVIARNQPEYFAGLLSLDEVDRVLTTSGRGYPDIILKNSAKDITPEDYTTGGETLDIARVAQLFAEGSTIALAYLDTVHPALTAFCRSLEADFSCPFQTNIYLTPPAAQGARPHYDTHDVFVLQVSGSKRWTLFGTPLELPLSGQEFNAAAHPIGEPTLEFELHAGDVAYVPRGVAHEARSTDEVSLHITAGVLRYTWADLLLEFVAGTCLNDPVLRKALPPGFARTGFDRSAARATFGSLLSRVSAAAGFDAALDRFVDQFLLSCPPLLRGQLGQAAAAERLSLDSAMALRDAVIWRFEEDAGSVVVRCAGRAIRFPAQAREAVHFALHQRRFVVRELPSSLTDEGKLVLVRRLVREGLLIALPA